MSWKKSLPYFAWQSVLYSKNFAEFNKNWSNYKRWKTSLRSEHNSVSDESAWINYEAIDFLNTWLKPEHKVFEFGGGGSTLFFLKRVGEVTTVENHNEWFEILTENIKKKGYLHWKGIFQEGEPILTDEKRSIENPLDYKSNTKGMENLSFKKYAQSIEQFPKKQFDLVLVDGRARPSCIHHSIPHIKSGGLLVVDNNDRPYYSISFKQVFSEQFDVVADTRSVIPYIPEYVRTTILRKK